MLQAKGASQGRGSASAEASPAGTLGDCWIEFPPFCCCCCCGALAGGPAGSIWGDCGEPRMIERVPEPVEGCDVIGLAAVTRFQIAADRRNDVIAEFE